MTAERHATKKSPYVNFYSYYGNGSRSSGSTMKIEVVNCDTGYIIERSKSISSGGSYKLRGNANKYRIRIKRSGTRNAGNSKWWAMRSNGGWFSNY